MSTAAPTSPLVPGSRRIDIDILRCAAVISVMLYHFDVAAISGGFLGVDIFFVISGYLITNQIRQQLENNTFSFMRFYARRAQRLLPALAVTMLLSTITALLLLPRPLLLDYLSSQVASSFYVSNIYFWSIADYFDTESHLKPLLHTWSLAVEEQFYLAWPLLLFLLGKRRTNIGIAVLGVASLISSEYMLTISNSTAFYIFPFRIFEFAIGAIIGRHHISQTHASNQLSLFAVAVAIATIVGSILLLDANSRMPGLLSLPITLATATIIYLRHPLLNQTSRLHRCMSRIGLTSYSAYLVHWPLVVFYKLKVSDNLKFVDTAILLLATLLIAEAFYRSIERPTQRLTIRVGTPVFLGSFFTLGVVSLVFFFSVPPLYDNLKPKNLSVQQILDGIQDRPSLFQQLFEKLPEYSDDDASYSILVVGDSHAVDVHFALRLALIDHKVNVKLLRSNCEPVFLDKGPSEVRKIYLNAQDTDAQTKKCLPYHAELIQKIVEQKPSLVIYSNRWNPLGIPYLSETLQQLKKSFGGNILILGPNVELRGDPRIQLMKVKTSDKINEEINKFMAEKSELESKIKNIASTNRLPYISKRELICEFDNCIFMVSNEFTYVDRSHWSEAGMRYYGAKLVQQESFKTAIEKARSDSASASKTGK